MRKHLHLIALVLFVLVLLFDLVVWGAVPLLPDVGVHIERSADKEALLASTYIAIGSRLDAALPAIGSFGSTLMTSAIEPAFARIVEDPNVAMDVILTSSFNRTHSWLKTLYWATPVLFVLSVLLWARKPKKISLIRGR